MKRREVFVGLALLGAVACGSSGRSTDFDTAGAPTEGVGDPAANPPPSGVFGDAGIDANGGPKTGCKGVDILFLVDNSSSMGDKQEKLALTWPKFVDAAFAKLPKGIEVHVGLTSTSFYVGATGEGTKDCKSLNSDADVAAHFVKPGTSNTGQNGGQGRLFQHEGKSFFVSNTSDDPAALKAWFAGAAVAVGETGSSFEFPAAGVAYVTDPANAAANAGFLRDEGAVLVLVFLSDEPDKGYAVDTAAHLHDMVSAAKKTCGGDKCVLTAGILDTCVPEKKQFLWEFMTSFGNPAPAVADIEGEESTYAAVVGDTLANAVSDTCAQISSPR